MLNYLQLTRLSCKSEGSIYYLKMYDIAKIEIVRIDSVILNFL